VEKPTQEQIREFWEWCGFERARFEPTVKGVSKYQYEVGYWVYPDNITDKMIWSQELPSIDLNNLFKYAVLRLHRFGLLDCSYNREIEMFNDSGELNSPEKISYRWRLLLETRILEPIDGYGETPALALFWAIYKVMKGGEIREEKPRINKSG